MFTFWLGAFQAPARVWRLPKRMYNYFKLSRWMPQLQNDRHYVYNWIPKVRQSEQKANLRYGVTYFSFLPFTAFCRLDYIISCDRMIRITRGILLETWPTTSWFKFKSGSSRTQSSGHYIETLNKSYVTHSEYARAIVLRWQVWEYYTHVVENCNRIFGSQPGPKCVMALEPM